MVLIILTSLIIIKVKLNKNISWYNEMYIDLNIRYSLKIKASPMEPTAYTLK